MELASLALTKYLDEDVSTSLSLTIEGAPMAPNYPLNANDSVVVTIVDTDDVTGLAVVPDTGSVSAVLSSTTDTIAPNADGTYTLTAGATVGVGNTVTINATVGGVASTPVVVTYDVVPAVAPADATSLSAIFGTESAPTGAPLGAPPLTATQLAVLVAAGVPFVSFPLNDSQVAALVAASVPAGRVIAGAGQPASIVEAGATYHFDEVTGNYVRN